MKKKFKILCLFCLVFFLNTKIIFSGQEDHKKIDSEQDTSLWLKFIERPCANILMMIYKFRIKIVKLDKKK